MPEFTTILKICTSRSGILDGSSCLLSFCLGRALPCWETDALYARLLLLWCEKESGWAWQARPWQSAFSWSCPKTLSSHHRRALCCWWRNSLLSACLCQKISLKRTNSFRCIMASLFVFDVTVRVYLSFPRVVNLRFKTLGKKGLVSLFPRR